MNNSYKEMRKKPMDERKDVLKDIENLKQEISSILTKYYEDEVVKVNFGNEPDNIQDKNSVDRFFYKLQEAVTEIEYMNYPVKNVGKLYYNSSIQRYCYEEHELHAGESLEVLIEDGFHDYPYWFATRIEFGKNGWYLVGLDKYVGMEGLETRIRVRSRGIWYG